MNIKTLNRAESQSAMKEWIQNYPKIPEFDKNYTSIREEICRFNNEVRSKSENISGKRDYYIDVHLGILLYDYLWRVQGFNLRVAANDDFWRYLSIKVVPDVVADRWGKDNESHYWSKPVRIWLRSIWWYVHLSWQGDMDSTAKVLEANCFSTDSILNLEERSGRKGTFIDVYRYIMYYYSRVPQNKLDEFNNNTQTKHEDLFRVIMKLHTAKSIVIDPALYLGGQKEYVRSLFADVGVRV